MAKAKSKRPKKLEDFKGTEFRPYVIALGQLTLAWNDLHEFLMYLFNALMPEDIVDGVHLGRAMAVWASTSQDRAAREMIRAALTAREEKFDEKNPSGVSDILWLLGQVHALEESRNNAIHSPLYKVHSDHPNYEKIERIQPDYIFFHARALKLARKPNLLAEFHWCRDAALILRDYADALRRALTPAEDAWPKRPSLPNRGQKKSRQDPRRQPPLE